MTDRREAHALFSKPRLVAVAMDIDALAVEANRAVDIAYQAHVREDWPTVLHFISEAAWATDAVHETARRLAGEIERAPVWVREDKAVVAATGVAA